MVTTVAWTVLFETPVLTLIYAEITDLYSWNNP